MAYMTIFFQTFLFLLVKCILSFQTSPISPYLVNSFTSVHNATLNHFIVSSNGSVYIGAVDYLYHLSQKFDVQSQNGFQMDGNRNVNKLLAIISSPVNELISCGTGLGRTCQFRNLNNVSKDVRYLSPLRLTIAPEEDTTVGLAVKKTSGRIALYTAQAVRQKDRLNRKPISSVCLHTRDQSRCTDDDDRETKFIANVKYDFIIRYVAVFSYQEFTYFIASQRKDATNEDSPIVTKMSRVCHNDETEDLSGFTEITLECNGKDNTAYTIAQSAVEVSGTLYVVSIKNIPEDGPHFKGTSQSALCVYEMETLITEFEESIINCSCSSGSSSNSNYLSNSGCHEVAACDTITEFTCFLPKGLNARYPERRNGLVALPGLPIFEHNETSFSSVIITKIDQPFNKSIAVIGTREGTLLKAHFDAGRRESGILYETLEMENSIQGDTWINEKGEKAMFLTEKQLLEINLANCNQFVTCEECIKPGSERGDPYCGWCTLQSRCTRYGQCNSSHIPSRWLWFNETECSGITHIMPRSLSVDDLSQMINIKVSNLPTPDGFGYTCHFGSFFTSPGTLTNGKILCLSPGERDIPAIPDGDDAVEVVLAISSTEFNTSFVSTTYSFFNCSRIDRCVDCVSIWPCNWCVDQLLCTYNLENVCSNTKTLDANTTDLCPMLLSGNTVVPSGVNREINVTARNLNLTSSLFQREYECVLTAKENKGVSFVTNANITPRENIDYDVTCRNREYSYPSDEQELQTSLSLRWKNTDVFLDGNFHVTLYKCGVGRPDCSRCLSNLTTRPELQCGWCINSHGHCSVDETCSFSFLHECSDTPKITSVSPTSSPVEGGTIVVINGTDLGQRFSDIVNVSLAGILCHHQNFCDEYQIGASVTCEAGISNTATQGSVALVLANNAEAEYEGDQFSFNNPKITSFFPMIGPESGGTLVNITGVHLQTGRNIRVKVGENDCSIKRHSSTVIFCRNQGVAANESSSQNQIVSVTFDGHKRLANEKFAYKQDPVVKSIFPSKTIKSGGNLLSVIGERFHLIQKPKIRFTINGSSAEEDCSYQDEMEITCKSPNVGSLLTQRRKRENATGTVDVGFIMDGVTDLLHWSPNNNEMFQYFQDPVYEEFDGVRDHPTTNKLLMLNGTRLNLASSSRDVHVFIGTEQCTVKSLEFTTLICELPDELTTGNVYRNLTSRDLPYVIVRHANLEFNIGYINFKDEISIASYVISALCAFIILTIITSVFITCYIRKKKTEKIRDLELQVQNIPDLVSANLKTLFATLQTTLHDFETIIGEQTDIPLLGKRQYLLNMMFLGQSKKPSASLSEGIVENAKVSVAMEEFSKVLCHKRFLKVLIQTLDSTSNISAMDRANAGSLLSVYLLQSGKMQLYTDFLLSVMQEHIQDCDSKRKQRSLFKGNDTMLEKMTSNWFAIFLYGFLKEQAATEVYQLYEAIKYVCEMGPIDVVSGKSQFSLNDQDMLDTQIDFNKVDIEVMDDGNGNVKEPLKVLDVNTVTQVKNRIISHNYRHTPYSRRPSPSACDLLWRAGTSGQLILRDDEDLPGTSEKRWKKICTLKDLNVPNGSIFELVKKQENPNAKLFSNDRVRENQNKDFFGYAYHLEGSESNSHQNELIDSCSDYEIVQKGYDVTLEDGMRVWHLIKEDQEDVPATETQKEPRARKEIKEVVLPFLPATRNYIQKYVDNFINAMFAADDGADVPLSIRYLFQFFDHEAEMEGKPGLSKAWKNNVLPLRYWSTILANPQYVLDVGVYSYTHACLRTIVQVIRDTCDGRIKGNKTQDFSPSRLLYSNFLKGYVSKLDNYYLFVNNLGRVNSEDFKQECQKVEKEFQGIFDLTNAEHNLYSFVEDHLKELVDALKEDDVCIELSLPETLQSVADIMRD